MGNLRRQTPLILVFTVILIGSVGLTAIILWTQQRPLVAEGETITANSTPIIVSNPADVASEVRAFSVIIEDQTILLNQKTNEQMVLYSPPSASPTPVPTAQEVAAVEEQSTPSPIPVTPIVAATATTAADVVAVPDNLQTPTVAPTAVSQVVVQNSGNKTLIKQHTVQSGDNLFRLACVNNSSIAMMSQAVSKEDLIVGTVVEIVYPNPNYCGTSAPAEYAVKEGDTIFKLSTMTGISTGDIQTINGLPNSNITAGDVLCFPAAVPQNC